jgi:hypothetical protein
MYSVLTKSKVLKRKKAECLVRKYLETFGSTSFMRMDIGREDVKELAVKTFLDACEKIGIIKL